MGRPPAHQMLMTDMPIELDHIFIWSSRDAVEEAAKLAAFGLVEGSANTHPGQGTACRRFFFRNVYLELLWVTNSVEAQSAAGGRMRFWERWTSRATGACPFGFGFRPQGQPAGSLPFATWAYRPPYLPESWNFRVGENSELLTEPMLFHLPFGQRPDSQPRENRQPLEHPAGVREISRFELVTPHARSLSPELETLKTTGLVQMQGGAEYCLVLGFDREAQGKTADFRPVLPLVLHH